MQPGPKGITEMLQQSLNVNCILFEVQSYCRDLRHESGQSLMVTEMPIATVVYDLLHQIGIPDSLISTALNTTEMAELAECHPTPTGLEIYCQRGGCHDQAELLVPYRGNVLLLCSHHACELESLDYIR